MPAMIDYIIINSPDEEPNHSWCYDRQTITFSPHPRRFASYRVISEFGVPKIDTTEKIDTHIARLK